MRFKIVTNNITPTSARQRRDLEKVPAKAYTNWVSITPKDTGNARRSTRLVGQTIRADYPYAKPLDTGWSKQAPKGMSKPTKEFVDKLIQRLLRK